MAATFQKMNELRQKRSKAIADARSILEAARGQGRAMTSEEDTNYGKYIQDAQDLKGQITNEEKHLELERTEAENEFAEDKENSGGIPADPDKRTREDFHRIVFSDYVRGGRRDQRAWEESKDLVQGDDTRGGYLTAPPTIVAGILKNVDDQVFIRQYAQKFQTAGSDTLGQLTLEDDFGDFDWTTELRTGAEDDLTFGRRELTAHPFAKRVKLSKDLLRHEQIGLEAYVQQRIGYRVGTTEENAFMLGNGIGQPLGLFVPSDDGIPVSRDVDRGNNATEITYDGLVAAKFSLKPAYRAASRWLFPTMVLEQLSKLRDGGGALVWRESAREGEPDRLLNIPYEESEFVPNTFTTGRYVGILGDYRFYYIADDLGMTIQRLTELYAERNQIGFIVRVAADGMPALAEAFVRIKLG